MSKVKITDHAIKRQLNKITPEDAISEFLWNGFDAGATVIKFDFVSEGLFNAIDQFSISDNGSGIDFNQLERKFIPFGESEKASKRKEENIALQGKNGYGRLTFFKFAKQARWYSNYQKGDEIHSYSIFIESKALDNYDNTEPVKKAVTNTGTVVEFNDLIIDFNPDYVKKKLIPYLTNEFAWYLEVNKEKGVQILINGIPLEYESLIIEKVDFTASIPDVEKKIPIEFLCTYIHWNAKLNDEFSKFWSGEIEPKIMITTRFVHFLF